MVKVIMLILSVLIISSCVQLAEIIVPDNYQPPKKVFFYDEQGRRKTIGHLEMSNGKVYHYNEQGRRITDGHLREE